MMDALMCYNPERQVQGDRILRNVGLYHKSMKERKEQEDSSDEEKD